MRLLFFPCTGRPLVSSVTASVVRLTRGMAIRFGYLVRKRSPGHLPTESDRLLEIAGSCWENYLQVH
jgi:hypothetical protein